FGKLDEAAGLQPVDDALDGCGVHGDELAELVLRGFTGLAELGQRSELRRCQVGDAGGEDRQMPLVRLAQDEAHLLLQMVFFRRQVLRSDQIKLRRAHLSPSSPFTSSTANPPMRLCTRGPQAMARQNRISSGRGPSGILIVTASKWLRT